MGVRPGQRPLPCQRDDPARSAGAAGVLQEAPEAALADDVVDREDRFLGRGLPGEQDVPDPLVGALLVIMDQELGAEVS